jgi:hypothetical protein
MSRRTRERANTSPRPSPTLRLAAAFAVCLALLGAGTASAQDNRLHLQTGDFDPLVETLQAPPEFARPTARMSGEGPRYFIAQLERKPVKADLDALRSAGLSPMAATHSNAYIVRASGEAASVGRMRSIPGVRWAGPLEPAMRVSSEVMAGHVAGDRAEFVDLTISLWPGESVEQAVADLRAMGVEVPAVFRSVYTPRFLARVDRAGVPDIAAMEAVQWIEPKAIIAKRNGVVAPAVQSGGAATPVWDRGIHGEGQVVGHVDGALDINHCFFRDPLNNTPRPDHRKVVGYRGAIGADDHGTHTAGTAMGKDFNGSLTNAGHAYEAKISHSADSVLTGFGDSPPSNLDALFMDAQNDGAFVHTNSYGDDNIRNYTYFCADIDLFTWNNEDATVFFAETNQNVQLFTPENAKNVVAVGNAQRPPNHANRTGCGIAPTADGRFKPDFYVSGTGTLSASDGTACGTDAKTGTSMACPAATGSGALVRQYFMEGFYPFGQATPGLEFTPSGALVRAVLLNSTVDMTAIPGYPSNNEGWGYLRLDNGLFFDGDARRLLVEDRRASAGDGIDQGEEQVFFIPVLSATEPLKITLAWNDPPVARQSNSAFDVTINNLDLVVEAPGGAATYLGNVMNNAMGVSMTGGSADVKNNIEMVILNNPTPGVYTVRVGGTTVNPMFGEQGFAIAASGDMAVGERGLLQLDRTHYPCGGSTIAITLRDGNAAGATIDVDVATTSGDMESVTLSMVSEGEYTGSIDVDAASAVTGNNMLEGADGDTITVAYDDPDAGKGPETIETTATLDCSPPELVVDSVEVVERTHTSAVVLFDANEPVTGDVVVGLSCGGASMAFPFGPNPGGGYRAELTGLTEGVIHFFRIDAEDRAGNASTFDDGGNCYNFFTFVREVSFETDFENGPDGYTTNNGTGATSWTLSDGVPQAHSPTHAYTVANAATTQDSRLVSPEVELGPTPDDLRFWHTFQFEVIDDFFGTTFPDGGVLEITTNGGTDWSDLGDDILSGGYGGPLDSGGTNPLAGRSAWRAGTIGAMTEVVVDLKPYANQTVQVRWRAGSNASTGDTGWRVDDVSFHRFVNAPGSTNRGAVSVDAPYYACGATVNITLGDGNAVGATIDVVVNTDSADTETVRLDMIAPGVYTGSLTIADERNPTAENGVIETGSGESFSLVYNDEDNGLGMAEEINSLPSTLDCEPAVIDGVVVSFRADTTATVQFASSEPLSVATLVAGASCGEETFTATATGSMGAYSGVFTGLSEGTTYYFRVDGADRVGNETTEDNSGSCYSFTTLVREVAFETDFEPGADGFVIDTLTGGTAAAWRRQTDALAHSPSNLFFAPNTAAAADARLVSPAIAIGPNPGTLSFWHTFEFESPDWDGGVLEITTNGGGAWADLGPSITQGGYNGTIASNGAPSIASRPAWVAGTAGPMSEVLVDLTAFANQTIQIRWRLGSDGLVGANGWRVDDISISRLIEAPGPNDIAGVVLR